MRSRYAKRYSKGLLRGWLTNRLSNQYHKKRRKTLSKNSNSIKAMIIALKLKLIINKTFSRDRNLIQEKDPQLLHL